MQSSFLELLMGYGGAVLAAFGIVWLVYITFTDEGSTPAQALGKYEKQLEEEVRFLHLKTTGRLIARVQIAIVAGLVFGTVYARSPFPLFALPVAIGAPLFYLRQQHAKRIWMIEQLLDSWLLLLANALKASPSLGEAIENSVRLVRSPMLEEIDLLIKEMRLGTPLDQAVVNLSNRLQSRTIAGALTTILVGRQTGGDLPGILEQSAATLREMQRLEGVVRTKTADGRFQAVVIGVMPYVLVGLLYMMNRELLMPLFTTVIGNLILSVAIILWLGAIMLARKILQVDL